MSLIVAVFVLFENMVVHGKDVLKLCLGLWWFVVLIFFFGGRYFEKSVLPGMWTLLKVGFVNFKEHGAICGVIA